MDSVPLADLTSESPVPDPVDASADGGDDAPEHATSLPPADRGKGAWSFLLSCVAVESLIWGFSFAYGIFQSEYESGPFRGSSNIATIGTTSSGIIYLSAPLVFAAFLASPLMRKIGPPIGLTMMCGSLVGSSFAEDVPTLIGTQGALYGIGCSLVYTPTILYLDEWFVARKGLAYGTLSAGSGLGGIALPFSINAAFTRFSFRTVLRAYACILFVLLGPVLFFMRPRLPPTARRRFNFAFLKTPAFVLLGLGNLLQSLGFFIPTVYLPTYATHLGASGSLGTLCVVLFNVASVAGCVLMGLLVDRLSVTTCIAISAAGSAASVFLFWGLSNGIGVLLAFCLLYGLFAGSFSSTWPGIMRTIVSKTARTEGTMVFAFLAAGRGIGNVVSGPISDVLIRAPTLHAEALPGYGSKYGPLILFTGATALLGGIAVSGRRIVA